MLSIYLQMKENELQNNILIVSIDADVCEQSLMT